MMRPVIGGKVASVKGGGREALSVETTLKTAPKSAVFCHLPHRVRLEWPAVLLPD